MTFRIAFRWLGKEGQAQKYFYGALLLVLTVTCTVTYYLVYPQVELNADTPSYLSVVQRFLVHPTLLADPVRLPGYPLFVALVYVIAGHGNLTAVSNVQAALFIVIAVEIYLIALLIFRRAWLACIVGILVGTSPIMISYVKPIMSEGLASLELTTLVLFVIYFLYVPRIWTFCLITVCLLPLLFTRPEWMYLPVPLFCYLILAVRRRGKTYQFRRYIIPATLSLVLIYSCVGAYIETNSVQSHYQGFTAIENLNWLGKVLQYHMQDEASPGEKPVSQPLDACIARIGIDPYPLIACDPSLGQGYAAPAGTFAKSIILHHPLEFFLKSLPLFFTSLTDYSDVPYHATGSSSQSSTFLAWLNPLYRALYWLNACFPLCALAWLFLLFWRRTATRQEVLMMGIVVLLVLYGIVVTTLGGYRSDDYMRVHTVFSPLLTLIIWGSVLQFFCYLPSLIARWRTSTILHSS